EGGREVSVAIPQITTEFILSALTPAESTEIADGTLFSPFYTMKVNYTLGSADKEVSTCLTIRKTRE
ncbi:MAG: hypothetical protein IJN46_06300, partial [Lachnospiraceae bacterium]|nr:hypothetical protein [Lachnospiraceae bacterium]